MFLGQFDHACDQKGRVAVPASFRPDLAAGAVVSIGPEGRLVIWPAARFDEHLRTLAISAGTPAEQRHYLRRINGGTRPADLDAQGRLLLHPAHREFAKIRERATFVGMGDHIELCSTERWEEESWEDSPEFFTELADRVNPLGYITPTPAPS
jgi:MraZ protein